MKNNFSFKRMGLMLKADWIEYKTAVLIFFASVFAIHLFLFLNMNEGFQIFLFTVGIISILLCFYIFTGSKVHRIKNRFLTLPASNIEKYVEILFVGFLLFCAYLLIYTGILGASHLISGEPVWFLSGSKAWESKNVFGMGLVVFICTFLFMCFIMFRKFPLQIGVLFLIAYSSVISYTVYLILKFENFNLNIPFSGFIRSNALLNTVGFLSTYNAWGMAVASAVLLYVSYLKLKEKQIR